MSKKELLRTFQYETDYEQVMSIWSTAGEGIQLRKSDEPEEIRKKLERDPDLFLVYEIDSQIVGAVLGGYDGRRGIMYHLAVQQPFRNYGIASKLVDELENRLKKKGCIRYYLLVTKGNESAIHFYENRGWEQLNLYVFGKDLAE